ncbi:MAG: type II toxin-antitoxin system RelE/ParE family toxin [Fimbriimonadaceae bacterium]|nr:type II toxin-antitoxin system RelE/ParE family toxin [Fimbriimonadaceae bacterium]
MTRRVEFGPAAEAELLEAAAWYAEHGPNLPRQLRREVQEAVRAIREQPERFPLLHQDIRRCLLRRFPYALLYRATHDLVVIVAVMHLSREPGYWQERLD